MVPGHSPVSFCISHLVYYVSYCPCVTAYIVSYRSFHVHIVLFHALAQRHDSGDAFRDVARFLGSFPDGSMEVCSEVCAGRCLYAQSTKLVRLCGPQHTQKYKI